MQFDILIIGAGAAGLMAAHELSNNGRKVGVIEADSRAGGRIETIVHDGELIELGAEFIHGEAPITDFLLKEIGARKLEVSGNMIPVHKGVWFSDNALAQNSKLLSGKLDSVKSDISIQQFLDQNFPAHEYEELRDSVIQFSEGFSLADIQKASVFALRKEWEQIEQDQFRIEGGYQVIIDHLFSACREDGVSFYFNTKASVIEHSAGKVFVRTDSKQFTASQVIVTCPLGILKSNEIKIIPSIDHVNTALTQLAFGSVIKVHFIFKESFWSKYDDGVGFILSDEEIPTWWTQNNESRLITGWLGGTRAEKYSNFSEAMIKKAAIRSLSNIFKLKEKHINELLKFHRIVCWNKKPFIRGGYSYSSVFSSEARKLLNDPAHGSIFFAGEAMYSGDLGGTVEAALASGKETAEEIMNNSG